MGIILLITSIVLFVLVLIPGIALTVVKCRHWDGYFGDVARATDMWGCVVFQYLLNATLLKSNCTHKFGALGEFISYVLELAYKEKTLTQVGLIICKWLIDLKDPAFNN